MCTCLSTPWKITSTLRVMQELHSLKGQYEYLPGGAESMIVYSFFQQGGGVAQNRTEQDLRMLRNTIFPAGSDLPDQLLVDADVTEGLSTYLRSTLRRLREITVMLSIDKLKNMTAESLDERQAEIDALLSLYTEQITKDYHACLIRYFPSISVITLSGWNLGGGRLRVLITFHFTCQNIGATG